MKEKIKHVLKDFKANISVLYGDRIKQIILFGSHARGDADEASDIDIMIVLKGNISPAEEIKRSSELIADLSLKFDTVISCLFASENKFQLKKTPLYLNIKKEGIVL
ncbi:MAG: nucleotidyltransferase domain-containing protein [Candidatus Gastranaerophilales bacterium]|jgi:predicted nucleotidyltransferase|nr:nucleotidyltransferase domain-containing protein [Candidatus Gastranaerophilales bacterium]